MRRAATRVRIEYWITDPQGIAWETYHTLGEAEIYGAQTKEVARRTSLLHAEACDQHIGQDRRQKCC